MKTEFLPARELDIDNFLNASFDDFQGFAWGPSVAFSASRAQSGTLDETTHSKTVDEAPPDFSFSDLWQIPQHLTQNQNGQSQHRLLNDEGQALSVPDLASASQENDLRDLGNNLAPQGQLRPRTPGSGDETFVDPEGSTGFLSGKDKSSSCCNNVEDLHINKSLSLAERNKQAQRRHRQRQRERMGTLENQVKVLNEEKQALAAEKAALAGQTAVLTQVLQMRDEQLRHLQNANTSTSRSGQGFEQEGSALESAVSSGLADNLSTMLTITVREDQQIRLSPEQVKAMKPQEIARTWAEYLSAMMRHLTAAQTGDPEVAKMAERRIADLIQEVLVLLMRYALGDLHKMKKFVASRPPQTGSPVGLANSEMWRAAAHNMELTDQQRQALCQLRRLFLKKQEALIAHRQRQMANLQLCVPNAASSHDIAAQFLKAEEAMGAIRRNLRMENQLIVDLIYTFLVRVASPIQAARCLVQSFPWYPDTLCILTWIAAEAGDVKAADLLHQKSLFAASSDRESGGGETSSPVASPSRSDTLPHDQNGVPFIPRPAHNPLLS